MEQRGRCRPVAGLVAPARLRTWANSQTAAGPSREASVIIGSGRLDTRRRGARDGPATGERGQRRRRRSSGRPGAALTQIPDRWRCKQVLIRADGAGYSHAPITALSQRGLDFSVGYPVTEAVRDAIRLAPDWAWPAANNTDAGCGSKPT